MTQQSALWYVGVNMPGFMPDERPAGFADWLDARHCLEGEIALDADIAFDQSEDGKEKEATASYDAAIEAIQALDEGTEFGRTIGRFHYFLTRG